MKNRTSSQTSSSHEEAVIGMVDCGEKGSWGRRGWLVAALGKYKQVSSCKLKVRTGCYQTFKAESIRLLLRQGEKRRWYQNLDTILIFCKVSLESTYWKQSHKPAQLDSPLCDPQENVRYPPISPSFRCSLRSSVGVLAEMKLSVSFKCSE